MLLSFFCMGSASLCLLLGFPVDPRREIGLILSLLHCVDSSSRVGLVQAKLTLALMINLCLSSLQWRARPGIHSAADLRAVFGAHRPAPGPPWWIALWGHAQRSCGSPRCTRSGRAAGMCRWASPGGTAPWHNPLTPAAGPETWWQSWHEKCPGTDASLEDIERRKKNLIIYTYLKQIYLLNKCSFGLLMIMNHHCTINQSINVCFLNKNIRYLL